MYGDEEWARSITVSNGQAQMEIAKHSSNWDAFVDEHGWHLTYPGATVLDWLGY